VALAARPVHVPEKSDRRDVVGLLEKRNADWFGSERVAR
jgi:hypothetical protein